MPDYKEMYLHLMRESERAVRILIQAQQDCEELYLGDSGPALVVLPGRSGEAAGQEAAEPQAADT